MTFTVFKCPSFTFSKKKETLESWHNWLLRNWCRLLNRKGPGTRPHSSKLFKWFLNLFSLFISINWPSLATWRVVVQKTYSKMHPVSYTNIHRDVTDLVNHWMVKNRKSWISWERKITFLRNKKFLTCSSDDPFWEVSVL